MKMRLAPEQDAVVHAEAGDIFVAAAAGSGKTRVLVARFVAAVLGEIPGAEACGVTGVLAVTFTDKAAGEIAERVRGSLLQEGKDAEARRLDQAWVSTIHSMCSKILRRYAFEAGLDPRFAVATQVEAGILEQESFEDAARALIASDPGVEQLITDFGSTRVASMVSNAHRALRSMGRAPADLRTAGNPSASLLREWQESFAEIAEEYPRVGSTQTCLDGARSARDRSEALAELRASADPQVAVRDALRVFASAAFQKRGSQDVKDLAESAKTLAATAQGGLAQILAGPYEQALVRVISAFDERYEALKTSRGVLDFEDLQLKTAELLETHPRVSAAYRAAFKLVMIDEFQDTNALQLRIAKALSSDDLLTVGDDKQSIYRFRHADVGVFRSLAESVPSVRVLRSNYRSHPDVIGAINEIFSATTFFGDDFISLGAMREEESPYLWSEAEPRVQMLLAESKGAHAEDKRAMEATMIARRLAELRQTGVPQGDMVVLLRAMKNRAEGIEAALVAEGFDVYVASGGTYFDRAEVDEVVALLSVIDNPRDDSALMKVMASRITALDETTLYRLANEARNGCLWESAHQPERLNVAAYEVASIARLVATIESLRESRGKRGIAELIHEACERLDYDLVLFASGPDGPRAWANVLKLARLAEEYEQRSSGDLGGFLEHVALHRDLAPEKQATLTGEGIDAVRIMSVHSAKGLEFPVVVVGDLSSDGGGGGANVLLGRESAPLISIKMPKPLFSDGNSVDTSAFTALKETETAQELEEADRLLYVACTRAREALILSACTDTAKPAEGACGIDRLRRAVGFSAPPAEMAFTHPLAGGGALAVRIETVPLPTPPVCEQLAPVDRALPPEGAEPALAPTPGVPQAVSYTGLSVYEACSYKFYATRIARLKTPATPGDVGPLNLGSALHAALQITKSSAPSAERLGAIARAHELGAEEITRLQLAVGAYLASTVAMDVASADRVQRECPFSVPLGGTLLQGSIDLLAWSGRNATVVDYKTGTGPVQAEDDGERYRSQAECYALAVLTGGAKHVTVRFVEVERGCRETRFEFGPDDAARIEERLSGIVSAITSGAFKPLDAYATRPCEDCPALGGTCPINPRRGAAVGAVRMRR